MPFGGALAPARIRDFLRAPAAKDAWIAQGTIYLVQNIVLLTALPLSLAVTSSRPCRPPHPRTRTSRWTSCSAESTSSAAWSGSAVCPLGESAGLLWADIWRRFSLVALVCVGAVLEWSPW
ncbi:hypothetical protein [Streptomyces vinaceus]|uniref:hypothetical protein n=1 Tax=Streptomyces vinaceus TaxID=1960 RepID=UPI00382CE091